MSSLRARKYAILSIGAALITIALKFTAYFLTGSVGLFSDAAESCVNLIAAVVALWALNFAAQPPDAEHTFGHSKAEYFSSGVEGALILVAAGTIALAAIDSEALPPRADRLAHPQPLQQLGLGLGLSLVATAVNGGVAVVLLRAGRRLRSIALRADAHHLLTDVWTSFGVVLGILLVKLTGWLVLDSIVALLVAVNIIWVGLNLIRETASGLLDTAIPTAEQQIIASILASYQETGIVFHALRTRTAGTRRFVSFHILVPGEWTILRGHDLCEEIELAIIKALPDTHVITHLEPLEDPKSWADEGLDR